MSRILTCLDNSIYAQSCGALTEWAARRMAAQVDLLNVIGGAGAATDFGVAAALPERPDIHARQHADAAEVGRQVEAAARALVDNMAAGLRAAGIGPVSTRVENGVFLDALVANSGAADLVVIGKRGEAADFLTLRLGSNMERAARACQKPLLIAARAFRPIGKALIAFDGSEHARDAVAAASTSPLMKDLAIEIVAVGAATPDAEAALADAAALLRLRGLTVSTRLVDGKPERRIPEIVAREGVDLLVMGAPSHSRLHTLVLGSTASALLRSCVIPALLMR